MIFYALFNWNKTIPKKQVTWGINIITDKWAGAYNPPTLHTTLKPQTNARHLIITLFDSYITSLKSTTKNRRILFYFCFALKNYCSLKKKNQLTVAKLISERLCFLMVAHCGQRQKTLIKNLLINKPSKNWRNDATEMSPNLVNTLLIRIKQKKKNQSLLSSHPFGQQPRGG